MTTGRGGVQILKGREGRKKGKKKSRSQRVISIWKSVDAVESYQEITLPKCKISLSRALKKTPGG